MAGATVGASAAFAASAEATTYTVTTNNDTATPAAANCTATSGGASCPTLRDALTAANADTSADTINFASSVTGRISLTDGALPISGSGGLTIQGPGSGTLTIDAQTPSQIFDITAPANTQETISGLTLRNGTATGSGGAIENVSPGGGGSTFSLIDSVITGSTAAGGGGAIYSEAPTTVTDSTISGNAASVSGGGIEMAANGLSKYPLTISGSTISGNTAQSGGGGVFGGTSSMSISDSKITGNKTVAPAGSGYLEGGGGIVADSGSLSIANSTLSGNSSTNYGGAIVSDTKYGTTITGSTISDNQASNGGGAEFRPSGLPELNGGVPSNPVTIQASTISGNQAGGSGSHGGGLLILGQQYDPIDLVDSTISGNSASDGAGVSLGNGGTTPLLGQSGSSVGSIAFDNSTIDGNSAGTAGGGIYLGQYLGGTPSAEQSATVDINSTIVAGNTESGSPNDLYRPTTSTSGGFKNSFSLIQAPGNAPLLSSQALITGVDPQLNPLANNGGPTETMLPKETSPVIDQGKAKSGLTTDQRGDPRTIDNGRPKPAGGDGTDIGAVELAKIALISATVGPASGITDTSATLHGTIDTHGEAVTWHFEYGTTASGARDARARASADPVTPTKSIGAGHGNVPVSFKVVHLRRGTRYRYRVVAVSSSGQTATSGYATFTTKKPTIDVKPGAIRAPHTVRVFGSAGACTRGSRVTLISSAFSPAHKFRGRNAVYTRVGKGFRYSVRTRIPAGRKPGRYAITGRCDGTAFRVTAYLRVLPPAVVRFTG